MNEIDTSDPSQDTLELARDMALEATMAIRKAVPEGFPNGEATAAVLLASGALLVAVCRASGVNMGDVIQGALQHLAKSYVAGPTVH